MFESWMKYFQSLGKPSNNIKASLSGSSINADICFWFISTFGSEGDMFYACKPSTDCFSISDTCLICVHQNVIII